MIVISMSVSYHTWLEQISGTLKTIYIWTTVIPWPDVTYWQKSQDEQRNQCFYEVTSRRDNNWYCQNLSLGLLNISYGLIFPKHFPPAHSQHPILPYYGLPMDTRVLAFPGSHLSYKHTRDVCVCVIAFLAHQSWISQVVGTEWLGFALHYNAWLTKIKVIYFLSSSFSKSDWPSQT